MKRLNLHIGTHKTGTSSIQEALIDNKSLLSENSVYVLDQNGIVKPDNFINMSNFYKLDTTGAILQNIGELEEFLSENSTKDGDYVMSSEAFSFMFEYDSLCELKAILTRYFDSVSVILYIRRQDEFAISFLQQASKGKNPESYMFGNTKRALPDECMSYFYDKYFDYYKLCSRWGDIFGDENLVIRKFEKNCLFNNDVVDDFFNLIKKNIDLDLSCNRANESSGFYSVKVGHLMKEVNIPRKNRIKIIKRLDNNIKSLPSRSEAIDFYSKYRQANLKLNERFNLDSDFCFLFKEDFSKYGDFSEDLWNEDSANLAIKKILELTASNLNYDHIDTNLIIDSAIALEDVDLKKSYSLMMIAHKSRPNGERINKKLQEYEKVLKKR